MDRIVKFLRTLDRKMRKRVEEAISRIHAGKIDQLDIKPLKGIKGHYRCRLGDIRILFVHTMGKSIVYDVGFRKDMYR